MNILAIETSSTSGSVAIARESVLIYNSYLDIRITHSERLLPQIDEALQQSSLKLADLDLVAISNGPGSFTGLRIGLAVAKGLCFGAKIPLYPLDTLRILAYNLYGSGLPVVCFQDARLGEVYAAMYNGDIEELKPPCCIKPGEFLREIKEEVIITGSGIKRFAAELKALKYKEALAHQQTPQAQAMIAAVLREKPEIKYDGDFLSALEPYYLRQTQAEILKEN